MASVIKKKAKKGTRYLIQLSAGENSKRPEITLGKVTKKEAETAKVNIENLISFHKTGEVIRPVTQDWIAGLPEGLYNRLEQLELVSPRSNRDQPTVKGWTDAYIKMREKDKSTKSDTVRKLENVARRLSVFFKNVKLDRISVYDAKMFKSYLLGEVGLSENTARKHIAISRQFFNAAIDKGLIKNNPFRGQPVTIRPNQNRFFFITSKMARQVLNACPDTQWRLIFGLARWGGLRCPSEILRLKWQDIDFEHNQFTVHASKTAHHIDGGIRTVPMFPELRPLFQDAFDMAKEGDVYCITRYRDKTTNLRSQMCRIIERAGLQPWPKLFQNLRSTRETELFKMTNGNIKAVCSWIGNSPAVAMKHYAQVTEADLQEAAKMTLLDDAEKSMQNSMQTTAEQDRTEPHKSNTGSDVSPYECDTKKEKTKACDSVRNAGNWAGLDSNQRRLTPMGLQPIPFSHSGTDPNERSDFTDQKP